MAGCQFGIPSKLPICSQTSSGDAIHAAVKNLERQLDVVLFDRTAYRAKLTDNGKAFHAKVALFLGEARALNEFSDQLRTGQETDLTIVI